jgi:hypothetical protein
MKKTKITLIFVPAILFLCVFAGVNVAAAQGGSGKVTPTPTNSPAKTKPKTIPKTSKTRSRKTPDPPIADWEMTNLIGHWEGTYNNMKSTLEIERVEGDEFFGYFTVPGFKIKFTGKVVRAERKIIFAETDALEGNYNDWKMSVNKGTLKYGGFDMKGTGEDYAGTVHTWSYIQMLL